MTKKPFGLQEYVEAILTVRGKNNPCIPAGEEIQKCFPGILDLAKKFPKAARGRRGVVESIYKSGFISKGDIVIAKIPEQRIFEM